MKSLKNVLASLAFIFGIGLAFIPASFASSTAVADVQAKLPSDCTVFETCSTTGSITCTTNSIGTGTVLRDNSCNTATLFEK